MRRGGIKQSILCRGAARQAHRSDERFGACGARGADGRGWVTVTRGRKWWEQDGEGEQTKKRKYVNERRQQEVGGCGVSVGRDLHATRWTESKLL